MSKILFDIVRVQQESDRSNNYIAIGYLYDVDYPHSALIIKIEDVLNLNPKKSIERMMHKFVNQFSQK